MTQFVRIRSEAGAPCRLRPGIAGRLAVRALGGGPDPTWRTLADGTVEITLRAGHEVVVYAAGTHPDLTVAPVAPATRAPAWGLPDRPARREFVPVDLAAVFTGDGIATAANPAAGNFDGAGYSYPAENLPPAGPVTVQEVDFTFPGEGAKNYVLCTGQVVPVPRGRYRKVWFLAASTTFNSYPNPGANYADGASVPMPLPVTEWVRGSTAFTDTEVISSPYRYGPAGRDDREVGIYLQVADLDPTTDLVSLALPSTTNPELRVFAVSLER